MKKLIIFGNTELAELAHYYFTNDSEYEVVGFCLDQNFITEPSFKALPVYAFEQIKNTCPAEEYNLFIAAGYREVNLFRKTKFLEAKAMGYTLASYLSSKTHAWPLLKLGENCMIMEGNTIMPFCEIGNNVLVWVNSILSHHSKIQDHVCITSHCAVGGKVEISERAFLGLNCTIRHGLLVGEAAVIGSSANLLENAEANQVYIGNPARKTGRSSSDYKI